MVNESSEFENRVKSSFSKVKEDIDILRLEIESNKKKIIELIDLVRDFISKYESKPNKFQENILNDVSSIGNEGVQSINQSPINQSINHPFAILDVIEAFSKGELQALLTLYQLEEEKKNVTYFDISHKLSLSESCIRSYISTAIKKGAPINRKKINNRLTFLYIDPKFRELGLKNKLINLYYQRDPEQKRLLDI